MNVHDVYPKKSNYLSASEIFKEANKGREHEVTITAVGRVEFEEGAKIVVSLDRGDGVPLEESLVVNKTNASTLSLAYGGDDIERAWVGKALTLYETHTSMGPGIGVRIPREPRTPVPLRTEKGVGVDVDERPRIKFSDPSPF